MEILFISKFKLEKKGTLKNYKEFDLDDLINLKPSLLHTLRQET